MMPWALKRSQRSETMGVQTENCRLIGSVHSFGSSARKSIRIRKTDKISDLSSREIWGCTAPVVHWTDIWDHPRQLCHWDDFRNSLMHSPSVISQSFWDCWRCCGTCNFTVGWVILGRVRERFGGGFKRVSIPPQTRNGTKNGGREGIFDVWVNFSIDSLVSFYLSPEMKRKMSFRKSLHHKMSHGHKLNI